MSNSGGWAGEEGRNGNSSDAGGAESASALDAATPVAATWRRRVLGVPVPVWLLALVVLLALVAGGSFVLPRLRPDEPAQPPGDQTAPQAVPTLGPGGPDTSDAGGPGGAAPTGPEPGSTPAAARPQPGGASGTPPALELAGFVAEKRALLDLLPLGLLGWTVTITIENPADVAQAWTNVSIVVGDGRDLAGDALVPGVRVYDSGHLVCAEPDDAASGQVPAGGAVTIQFTVRSSGEPHSPSLDNDDCDPTTA
jgi:hypothetical protein